MSVKEFEYGEVELRKPLTHKLLKEAVEVIMENGNEMVLILHGEGKPEYFWSKELEGVEYVGEENKVDYIKEKTGLEREDFILPVSKEVLDKVSANIGSKAIAKVEKELYDIVVEAN